MNFYITKKAVYLHGVYGPYKTRDEAVTAFESAYDAVRKKADRGYWNEFDGHHEYRLIEGLPVFDGATMKVDGEQLNYEALKP